MRRSSKHPPKLPPWYPHGDPKSRYGASIELPLYEAPGLDALMQTYDVSEREVLSATGCRDDVLRLAATNGLTSDEALSICNLLWQRGFAVGMRDIFGADWRPYAVRAFA